MRWLEAHGRGVEVGPLRVPIVCGAVLFDLVVGRADVRPDAAAGEAACDAASTAPVAQGSVGAGTGATVGKMLGFARATKSGMGSASLRLAGASPWARSWPSTPPATSSTRPAALCWQARACPAAASRAPLNGSGSTRPACSRRQHHDRRGRHGRRAHQV